MTLLSLSSRSSVDRTPAMCSRGHEFDSCRGLRFFFVPRSCQVDQFAFHILLPSLIFTIFIYLSQHLLYYVNSLQSLNVLLETSYLYLKGWSFYLILFHHTPHYALIVRTFLRMRKAHIPKKTIVMQIANRYIM